MRKNLIYALFVSILWVSSSPGASGAEESGQVLLSADAAPKGGRFEQLLLEHGILSADEPLVTIKLHGLPLMLQQQPALPEPREEAPSPPETSPEPRKEISPEPQPEPEEAKETVGSPDKSEPSQDTRRALTSADILFPESEPMVTIKLHGTPNILRGGQEPPKQTPAAEKPAGKPTEKPVSAESALSQEAASPPLPPSQPKPPVAPAAPREMQWPVSGKITSGFGPRGKRRYHTGIDIPMPKNTPITAAQSGVVLDVGTAKSKQYRGYGNVALIDHRNGTVTLYAHCSSVSVKKGQEINQGDVIGLVGNTGRTTTSHLHFEVRKNGKPVNPLPYLPPR